MKKIGHELITIETGNGFMGPLHYFEIFHNKELKISNKYLLTTNNVLIIVLSNVE